MPNYKIIKQLRKDRKISAGILAKYIGYDSRQSIYDIESGRVQNIDYEKLLKICEILQVDKSLFFPEEKMEADNLTMYQPTKQLDQIKVSAERMAFLLEENRILWRENSMLKTVIIKNNISLTN